MAMYTMSFDLRIRIRIRILAVKSTVLSAAYACMSIIIINKQKITKAKKWSGGIIQFKV